MIDSKLMEQLRTEYERLTQEKDCKLQALNSAEDDLITAKEQYGVAHKAWQSLHVFMEAQSHTHLSSDRIHVSR